MSIDVSDGHRFTLMHSPCLLSGVVHLSADSVIIKVIIIYSGKTKYMITSRHQNVIQNQNIIIGNLLFENVQKFRYLGVTKTNDIREGIKRRINMGNACYYSLEKNFIVPSAFQEIES